MIASPTTDVVRPTAPAPSGFAVLCRELLRGNRWLLVPAVLGVVAVPAVAATVHRVAGPLDTSAWEFAGQPLRWILFATGIVLGYALPVVVAHGITRRTFAQAAAVCIGVVALAGGVYMAAGYLVERAVYAAYDLPPRLGDGHMFSDTGQVHLVLAEYSLAFAGYLVSGWLTMLCYYRLRWLWGTLCLPLTLLPLVAVEASLIASTWVLNLFWRIFTGEFYDRIPEPFPAPVRIGLALLVIAAGLVAARLASRRLPLRSPGA